MFMRRTPRLELPLSLRGKFLLLIASTLLLVGIVVMLVTQRDVTNNIIKNELHAVSNIMDLVVRDTDTRWSTLLDDKIRTIRESRRQLIQLSAVVISVLNAYAAQAERGHVTTGAAKGMARVWLNHLDLGPRRVAFAYDAEGTVLASTNPRMIDRDLSGIRDFKGRPLAAAMYEESRNGGRGFAIYPSPLDESAQMRHAYFVYFPAWKWVLAISDSSQAIIDKVAAQKASMIAAIDRNLSELRLSRHGFVFVVADDGTVIVPPPPSASRLLDSTDVESGRVLHTMLAEISSTRGLTLRFTNSESAWQIDALRYKPLHWTIIGVVPEPDLTDPAQNLVRRQALIFAATLLAGLMLAWVVAVRIARPLAQLSNYARQLPNQDLTEPIRVPPSVACLPRRRRDEVGQLAESFLFMNEQLHHNVRALMAQISNRERLESELSIARSIQLGLLPQPLSDAATRGSQLRAVMYPAREVGGDFYDYFVLADGRLCFAIGDVSGKGVPAALFMAIVRTLIRSVAEEEHDPGAIATKVNHRLAENNPKLMFVTLLIGVFTPETGALAWVNAGHPPPLLIDERGEVRLLQGSSGAACGVLDNEAYSTLSTTLPNGTSLVAFTDGVTEAIHGGCAQYGLPRLVALMQGAPRAAAELIEHILHDLREFAADSEQSDDLTIIAIHRP
ncbi:SpoIIE family protein phosphatase [Bordetella bronchiseptica]|uniref:SpoIIE family protein phosphatase n=1 Tax=Bordetella bronchiseptica TaxID=518 RepID=UPI0040415771